MALNKFQNGDQRKGSFRVADLRNLMGPLKSLIGGNRCFLGFTEVAVYECTGERNLERTEYKVVEGDYTNHIYMKDKIIRFNGMQFSDVVGTEEQKKGGKKVLIDNKYTSAVLDGYMATNCYIPIPLHIPYIYTGLAFLENYKQTVSNGGTPTTEVNLTGTDLIATIGVPQGYMKKR